MIGGSVVVRLVAEWHLLRKTSGGPDGWRDALPLFLVRCGVASPRQQRPGLFDEGRALDFVPPLARLERDSPPHGWCLCFNVVIVVGVSIGVARM